MERQYTVGYDVVEIDSEFNRDKWSQVVERFLGESM